MARRKGVRRNARQVLQRQRRKLHLLYEAVHGKTGVVLWVKGFRDMKNNFFSFGKGSLHNEAISVPEVCRLFGIDVQLVHGIYFHYRRLEWWTPGGVQQVDDEVAGAASHEAWQIITDMFPFPSIHWMREMPMMEDSYNLGMFYPRSTEPDLGAIRALTDPGKEAYEKCMVASPGVIWFSRSLSL